jgi:putative flippase GtrA
MKITKKKEFERFSKFAVVGVIGAVIDFGLFNLLTHMTKITDRNASIASFIAAIISNFLWNRFWTYPDSREKKIGRQLFQFIIVSVIGLGIRAFLFNPVNNGMLSVMENFTPEKFFVTPAFLGKNFTLAFLVILVMFWNFFANRFWTYNDVQ